MHTTRSRFVEHDGLRLHYLDSSGDDTDPTHHPVVFVPGMGDEAEEYHDLLDDLLPRRVLSVDVRGRGASEVPDSGWSPAHHVSDLDAIIGDSGVGRVHMASYSAPATRSVGRSRTPTGCSPSPSATTSPGT
ncbi:MAG: alpha/beta fold hydrolase [Acidimicrobiia bacterium]